MSNTTRVTSKGQVTIPQEIRKALKLLPHTEVEFSLKKGAAVLKKATRSSRAQSRGKQLLDSLRGKASIKMTTEQILQLTRK